MDGNDPFGGQHAVVHTKVKIECCTQEKEEGGFRFFTEHGRLYTMTKISANFIICLQIFAL